MDDQAITTLADALARAQESRVSRKRRSRDRQASINPEAVVAGVGAFIATRAAQVRD